MNLAKTDLLEKELKKLVANQIKIQENSSNWIITINKVNVSVPKINNTVIRTSILVNK